MTQTTNIGLKKIDGSENWRQIFDYHNDSADKTDSAVAAVQDGLAIVANGNTHAAVAEGQFVYVRNHSTLAEGLYKASSAIGTNATLSTSNLTADGSGGLNDLQGQVTSLNSKLTIATGITGLKAYKAAGLVNLVFEEVSASSASEGWITIGTLPNSLKPLGRNYFQCQTTDVSAFANNKVCNCYVDTNGEVKAYAFSDKLSMYLRGFVTYVCA